MVESQSRYGIIEELTNKLNEERERILKSKTGLEQSKAEVPTLKSTFVKKQMQELEDFENHWNDEREEAKKLEERCRETKEELDRKQARDKDNFEHNMSVKEASLTVLEISCKDSMAASELKIKEIKDAIDALKQVSKESGARNVEKPASKK